MNSEYLYKVLTSEESHLPNVNSKILELINYMNGLKSDVRTAVESGSIHVNPLLKENDRLKTKAEDLIKEMNEVEKQIDEEIKPEISGCADELQTLSHSLKEVNLFLVMLKKLTEINSMLKKAREKMDSKEFYECAKLVKTIQDLVKKNSQKLKQVEIFKILSQEIILTYEQLMYQISKTWSDCINVDLKDDMTKNSTQITLVLDVLSNSELNEILKASYCLESNLIEKKFGNVLLNEIFNKIIKKKSEITVNNNNKPTLNILVFNNVDNSNYLEISDSIKTVIDFLKLHLNIEVGENEKFLSRVGRCIAEDFIDSLIKNCLSETIPTNSEDLEKYNDIVENAKVLEETLKEAGFLPGSSSSLMDYAKNINVLFANKFCQSYLNKARVIMKKDLHNINKSDGIVTDISALPTKYKTILQSKMNIQEDIFSFPKCQISKQAEELLSLIHTMMKEIQKCMDFCAVRLFFTVRNIFEMYSAIVPLYHKKFLETLPQQVAIFHNNCMYFSHNLINLAAELYVKIPEILKIHFPILLEEAIVLRTLAAETLEVTVTNQRNQIVYILRDSGFATLNENPKLDPTSEKSIRQCIRQLQILQSVWSDVLPINIYTRAIGFLLDSITEELINFIIVVEDISLQTASDLVSSFSIILERSPNLFPEPAEVPIYAKKWKKFKEFVLILKGSLRDIDDRWADGMGPLSLEFTADQVKHMIRALFQNSERRAALLARIR